MNVFTFDELDVTTVRESQEDNVARSHSADLKSHMNTLSSEELEFILDETGPGVRVKLMDYALLPCAL